MLKAVFTNPLLTDTLKKEVVKLWASPTTGADDLITIKYDVSCMLLLYTCTLACLAAAAGCKLQLSPIKKQNIRYQQWRCDGNVQLM